MFCSTRFSIIFPSFFYSQFKAVRRFNKTSSIYQTPVERHWGDANQMTSKFKREFELLECLGAMSVDDPGDIFSVIAVYKAAFESDVNEHYLSMRNRLKKVDTLNPDYPAGKQRRWELYTMYPGLLTARSADELRAVSALGEDYWGQDEVTSPWQIDPLAAQCDRVARSAALDELRPLSLAQEYVAHRSFTLQRLQAPGASASALISAFDAASAAVRDLSVRMAQCLG